MREHGLAGAVRGKVKRTTIADPAGATGPRTWSSATSPRWRRTGCGSPTSPTCRPGRAGSTSRSSSTPTPGGSWAGGAATTMTTQLVLDALEQAIWTRERAGRSLDSVVAHTRSRVAIHVDPVHRTARRGRDRRLGRLRRRLLRQRAGRDDQRPVQDRADQTPRPVAHRRRTSRSPPPSGSTGSTTAASTSTAATSHRPTSRPPTTLKPEPSSS